MSYYIDHIRPKLTELKSLADSGRGAPKDSLTYDELERSVYLAPPREAFDILCEFNSYKRPFWRTFHLIPDGHKERIRIALVQLFFRKASLTELDSYIRKISRGEMRRHAALKIISFGLNDRQVLSIIESARLIKETEVALGVAYTLVSSVITDDNRGTQIVKKAAEYIQPKRVNKRKEALEKARERVALDEEPGLGPSTVNLEAYFLTTADRENLENYVVMINELNHAELIGALVQFRINGLEERIDKLEEKKKESFFSFLIDLAVTFVVPFAIGKIAKDLVSKAVKRKNTSFIKSAQEIASAYKDPNFARMVLEIEMKATPHVSNWYGKFEKLPDTIKEHIDDYAQFGVDLTVKFESYRSKKPSSGGGVKSLNEFIAKSISDNRVEILELQRNIKRYSDQDLTIEAANKTAIDFSSFYNSLASKLREFESEQSSKRFIEGLKRKRQAEERSEEEKDAPGFPY